MHCIFLFFIFLYILGFYSKDGDGTKWETLQAKKKRVMNYKLIHVSGIPMALATNKVIHH